ncbi:MAG: CBS domain-containing protein, partial [Lachnospiraceae bacterium]|nr:CBS domain-containing protein [Lachnospiraceae bacterium]
VIGLITDRDITLRAVAEGKDTKQLKAQDIMSTKIYKVEDTVDVTEASKLMCDCQVKRVPVTSNNAIVGIITLADLTNNHANISDQEITTTLKRICDWH